ncbi:MAG: type II toxin-antitoxin system RelE/ParE family toxin [Alphaproteobacteria bacterium]|nr:type II toxin-antitoxin system RelE/ParE family toxin [Alphaproteobacteria bacterium]
MPILLRTHQAERDIEDLGLYIAQYNRNAAIKLTDRIEAVCFLLADFPFIGRARPEISDKVRSFPLDNVLILYRPIEGGVEIVRVVHGARHLPDLF